jgi:hypothetical protein
VYHSICTYRNQLCRGVWVAFCYRQLLLTGMLPSGSRPELGAATARGEYQTDVLADRAAGRLHGETGAGTCLTAGGLPSVPARVAAVDDPDSGPVEHAVLRLFPGPRGTRRDQAAGGPWCTGPGLRAGSERSRAWTTRRRWDHGDPPDRGWIRPVRSAEAGRSGDAGRRAPVSAVQGRW